MLCNDMIDINNTDIVTLFWYTVIFIGTIYAFSRIDIKLSVLYGTFIVLIILYFLNNEYMNTKKTINDILKTKKDSIFPQSVRLANYNDVVNFLFSIQDFYIYNPQAYEDMIQSLDIFFIFYEEVLNNNELAGEHYDVLNDKRRYALNSLQSLIYNFPVNVKYTQKLNASVNTLDTILQMYLNNIKSNNANNIYTNGYHMTTKLITNDTVVPYNTFDNTENFDMY